MISIRGIYDGQVILPLEGINAEKNSEVIITFLETQPNATDDARTRKLLNLCGSWESSRTAEEIVHDIYSSRVNSTRLQKGL